MAEGWLGARCVVLEVVQKSVILNQSEMKFTRTVVDIPAGLTPNVPRQAL